MSLAVALEEVLREGEGDGEGLRVYELYQH